MLVILASVLSEEHRSKLRKSVNEAGHWEAQNRDLFEAESVCLAVKVGPSYTTHDPYHTQQSFSSTFSRQAGGVIGTSSKRTYVTCMRGCRMPDAFYSIAGLLAPGGLVGFLVTFWQPGVRISLECFFFLLSSW